MYDPTIGRWHVIDNLAEITCSLEFLQKLDKPFLENIRAGFIGRSLIGNAFSWADIVYYLIGGALSWFWLWKVDKS